MLALLAVLCCVGLPLLAFAVIAVTGRLNRPKSTGPSRIQPMKTISSDLTEATAKDEPRL